MATTILVINPKGGTGKTTVADELVFGFQARQYRTGFINLDNQGGAIHDTDEESFLYSSDVVVIDTPGRLDERTTSWLSDADFVLVVSRPSVRDLPATVELINLIPESKPWGMVVNGYSSTEVASREFLEIARQRNWRIVGKLPHSAQFVRAATASKSVTELYPYSPPTGAVNQLVANLIKEIN